MSLSHSAPIKMERLRASRCCVFLLFFFKGRAAPLLQALLWDIYNTAEVLQVESSMNNGGASVLLSCCADTDTVAALLMGTGT